MRGAFAAPASIIASMERHETRGDAAAFYEEDEAPEDVRAAFERAPKALAGRAAD